MFSVPFWLNHINIIISKVTLSVFYFNEVCHGNALILEERHSLLFTVITDIHALVIRIPDSIVEIHNLPVV